MSIKKKARRIDLDTEEHIYHLKVNVAQILIRFPSTVEINKTVKGVQRSSIWNAFLIVNLFLGEVSGFV